MAFRIGLVLVLGFLGGSARGQEGVIRLPLRVHLIQGVELEQKGVRMSTWVTAREFEEVVLPEVNRIWKAAHLLRCA